MHRYTLLATKELFERGVDGDDADATMLLNHKRAIEYLVEGVPTEGLTMAVLRNLHATLMEALLANDNALGASFVDVDPSDYAQAMLGIYALREHVGGRGSLRMDLPQIHQEVRRGEKLFRRTGPEAPSLSARNEGMGRGGTPDVKDRDA